MKTCERVILAIVSYCAMAACGCPATAKPDPVQEATKEGCPYKTPTTCATIPAGKLGARLTLRPDKDNIPIREITDESETATHADVPLGKILSHCSETVTYLDNSSKISVNWNPIDKDYDLRIVAPPGGKSYPKIRLVPERKDTGKPPETVNSHVYWMRGSDRASGLNYSVEFYVYLYDEQKDDNSPMEKHYLIEVYDQTCNQDSPSIEGNIRPRVAGPHPIGGQLVQPSTGNGWEPHHP